MRKLIDWGSVDWVKQDIVIADGLGVSRERVRQVRKELGKAKPENSRKHRDSLLIKLASIDTTDKTLEDISFKMKYTTGHVRNALVQLGKVWKKEDRRFGGKYHWEKITSEQWQSLTDKEIAKRLRVKNPAVVTLHRMRHGIKKRGVKGIVSV